MQQLFGHPAAASGQCLVDGMKRADCSAHSGSIPSLPWPLSVLDCTHAGHCSMISKGRCWDGDLQAHLKCSTWVLFDREHAEVFRLTDLSIRHLFDVDAAAVACCNIAEQVLEAWHPADLLKCRNVHPDS